MRRTLLYIALYVACAGLVHAQSALPSGVRKVTSIEGITEYRMENGLTVLLFPDPGKQTITVNMTYLVGSRHEGYGETGMAHLLEHLLFLGTPNHKAIDQEFRKYGASYNGSTSWDRTNYFETFPASDANLRWALDLESDRMLHSFVSKELLDREMTVVRNEFERGENEPFRVLFQRTMAAAFLWHNYGKATIGSKSDLENVPIDRLRAFYQKYYQPDNAVLTVAGKIEEPQALALVAEYFSKLSKPARVLDKTYTLDPVQDGERTVTVRRVGDIQALMVAYKIPDAAHPDSAALEVLSRILGSAPSGRLHKALVETKKAASVGASALSLREPGIMFVTTTVRKEGNLPEAREILLRVVHDLVKEPPTQEEVDRAKNATLSMIERELSDSDRVGLLLSEPAAAGDWRLIFRDREMLRSVTPEDVMRVAKAYLKEDNRTIGTYVPVDKPDRSEIPAPTDITAALKDLKITTEIAKAETFDATPANIEKRLVRSTLPNGMKVLLMPKKTRANTVHALIHLSFGDVESLANRERANQFVSAMLSRGTKKHTRQQIRDEMDRLKARIFASGGGGTGSIGMSAETSRQNLPAVLTLMTEMLREPSFPADEFEQLKQGALAGQEQRKSDPQTLATAALNVHLNPFPKGDVRHREMPEESIEDTRAVTIEEVRKFYADFYGASNAELVVTGDHDPQEIQALAAKLLGDWKSPKKFARTTQPFKAVESIEKTIATPDKANATYTAGMSLAIGDKHADYPALLLANSIFGGSSAGRLFSRIRTKEGLSYGVGSRFLARQDQESGSFTAFAIAAPQNIAKVDTTFREELAKAIKDGFTEAEVAEAKKSLLDRRAVARSQDAALASLLSELTFLDRGLQYETELDNKIAALTTQQVSEAFRRHIDPAKMSYFKAGDFRTANP